MKLEADIVYLQNKTIGKNHIQQAGYKYKSWYKAYDQIVVDNLVSPKTDPGDYIIEKSGDITIHAGNSISLKPGFHTQNGSDFHAFIYYNYSCTKPRDGKGQGYINDNIPSDIEVDYKSEELAASIYPNPSNGSFTVEIPAEWKNSNYEIFNLQGDKITQGTFLKERNVVDLRASVGLYLPKIQTSSKIVSYKIRVL